MCIGANLPEPEEENVDYGIYAPEIHEHEQDRVHPDLVAARHLQQNIIMNHFI